MGKIRSAASGIGGAASNVRSSVMSFEQAPLANAAYLLTIGAICVALPTFVVALVLAINNIGIANQSNMSSARGDFLSAGTLYLESISTPIFVALFVAALVLFVVHKAKHPVSKGGQPIGYELRIWAMGALFSLVVAPLVLLFAENILTIVIVTAVCVLVFLFLSSAGSGEGGNAAASASGRKGEAPEEVDDRPVKKVDKSTKVFRSGTVLSGNGIFGYAGWPNDAFYICSESDYDNGKVRIVDRQTGRDHSPILSGPPKGAEAALSKWERQ